jgi:hypothetical protein
MKASRPVTAALIACLYTWHVAPLCTSNVRPAGLDDRYEAVPLGQIRVTHYTHNEGGRMTSSGHTLEDGDAGQVCAISRDWWRGTVKPGDLIWIPGHTEPCVALDTMALANRKGFKQRRWVDIYSTDRKAALDFGIQRATAYIVRLR